MAQTEYIRGWLADAAWMQRMASMTIMQVDPEEHVGLIPREAEK